ncbi:DUF4932 domain-containing protein [Dyadobacter beijingensis]|uniref:DUF4932 domain-containing protein n=1 Tax=Dyadobacter beijingensis TaxID=365489 RepID=UPI00146AF265|nr:DUF4932 domain-containing protein [Dyadobacter beijingensis]
MKFITLAALVHMSPCVCAQTPRIVRATGDRADIRDGDEFSKGSWRISPTLNPDVYESYMEGKSKKFTFITDRDSITFDVEPGKSYPFVVLMDGKDSAFTEVRGIRLEPRAKFSAEYQRLHRGKTSVEVPEVYELVNVIFALTEKGRQDNGLIRRDTPYYQEVMQWFEAYRDNEAVRNMNSAFSSTPDAQHSKKMDAYPFEFNDRDSIVQGKIYDRIGNSYTNALREHIPDLIDFARQTRFREFYQKHIPFYNGLVATYRDSVGVPDMQRWLNLNFPSTRYDSFKVIFSPLVSANQSASWFNLDGFREVQAHVNFPFRKPGTPSRFSKKARQIMAGDIVFTELNHGFIGPEGEKAANRSRIQKAFSDLTIWNDSTKSARYYDTPQSAFDEYMNWALVSLRYADVAPQAEQPQLFASVENMMVDVRGFRKFAEFNQFLVKTYQARKKGQVVADLYPQILTWFEDNQ